MSLNEWTWYVKSVVFPRILSALNASRHTLTWHRKRIARIQAFFSIAIHDSRASARPVCESMELGRSGSLYTSPKRIIVFMNPFIWMERVFLLCRYIYWFPKIPTTDGSDGRIDVLLTNLCVYSCNQNNPETNINTAAANSFQWVRLTTARACESSMKTEDRTSTNAHTTHRHTRERSRTR